MEIDCEIKRVERMKEGLEGMDVVGEGGSFEKHLKLIDIVLQRR